MLISSFIFIFLNMKCIFHDTQLVMFFVCWDVFLNFFLHTHTHTHIHFMSYNHKLISEKAGFLLLLLLLWSLFVLQLLVRWMSLRMIPVQVLRTIWAKAEKPQELMMR